MKRPHCQPSARCRHSTGWKPKPRCARSRAIWSEPLMTDSYRETHLGDGIHAARNGRCIWLRRWDGGQVIAL
jgi:hypothetical protein